MCDDAFAASSVMPDGFLDVDELYARHAAILAAAGEADWPERALADISTHRDELIARYARGDVPGSESSGYPERARRVISWLGALSDPR
jgi:hypothetical protein